MEKMITEEDYQKLISEVDIVLEEMYKETTWDNSIINLNDLLQAYTEFMISMARIMYYTLVKEDYLISNKVLKIMKFYKNLYYKIGASNLTTDELIVFDKYVQETEQEVRETIDKVAIMLLKP
jgi:hypothetical protein